MARERLGNRECRAPVRGQRAHSVVCRVGARIDSRRDGRSDECRTNCSILLPTRNQSCSMEQKTADSYRSRAAGADSMWGKDRNVQNGIERRAAYRAAPFRSLGVPGEGSGQVRPISGITFPGFIIPFGSNTALTPRISSISSAEREYERNSRFNMPTPCSAEMLPL